MNAAEEPCFVAPPPLTRNQKKKRRQRLSKLGKREGAAGEDMEQPSAQEVSVCSGAGQPSGALADCAGSAAKRPRLAPTPEAMPADWSGQELQPPPPRPGPPRQAAAQISLSSLAGSGLPPSSGVGGRLGGPCRVDLSAAALLISRHINLAPAPAAAGACPSDASVAPASQSGTTWASLASATVQRTPPGSSSDEGPAAAAGAGGRIDGDSDSDADLPLGPLPPLGGAGISGGGGALAASDSAARRRVFLYGNYHRYYGYRLGSAPATDDPRVQAMERSWFARRRVLDVGCNEGLLTLALATRFLPASLVGLDIDERLVRRACTHLREAHSAAAKSAVEARRPGMPAAARREARSRLATLGRTWFVHGDFMESSAQAGSFDTITCLSVTKWLHLHRGDEGLRAAFARMRALLAPGGLLVLEPQPWRSYRSALAKVSRKDVGPETFFHRQDELRLRPEGFASYLCQELGFRLVRRLAAAAPAAEASGGQGGDQPAASGAAAAQAAGRGFDRPILVLRKRS